MVFSLMILLAAGCDRQPPRPPEPAAKSLATSPPSASSETLEQAEARFDATVWRDEVLACRHEATIVNLRDTLRRATNKVAVLAGFDFDEISVPTPQGGPETLELGIRRQRFKDSDRRTLPWRAWAETLTQLSASGWRLEQGEWNHERFVPPTTNRPAMSQFSFHLHGERPPATRFNVEGTLDVEWGPTASPDSLVRAHRLVVSNFTVLERSGPPDFLTIGMSVPTVRRLEFMKLGRDDFPDRTRKRVDMAYGNRLYALRAGQWVAPAFADQLAGTLWSWGTSAFDFNNDGKVDVYVANGHLSGESGEDYSSHIWTHDIYVGSSREDSRLPIYFDKPFLGINTGKTSSDGYQHNVHFLDVGANDYLNVAYLMDVAHESDSRAVVSADLNNDGKPDLILTDGQWLGGPHTGLNRLHIHLNQSQTGNHWIGVKLASTAPGSSPIGAKVWVKTDERTYVAQIVTGDSYQSQHPSSVHFGLGKTRRVKELTVRWPNGKSRTLADPQTDRYHHLAP